MATIDCGQRTLKMWQTLLRLLARVNRASVMAGVKLVNEKLDSVW